jgi:cysteinyl-tRNA synthetase
LRQHDMKESQKWSVATFELQKNLSSSMSKVNAALKDDFDTPAVMSVLVDLVKATNVYMEGDEVVGLVVRNVASYISRIFKIFGLIPNDTIGFASAGSAEEGGANREEVLQPVLDALMNFRSVVREKARSKDTAGVLDLCDSFRDTVLPPMGIRLEDKAAGPVWKLADPKELMLEMEQKVAEALRKAEKKAETAAEDAKKDALNRLSPADLMKQLTLEDGTTLLYSKFDETGLPTHDSAGEVLNKSQSKKIQKAFKAQQTKYEKYLKSQDEC